MKMLLNESCKWILKMKMIMNDQDFQVHYTQVKLTILIQIKLVQYQSVVQLFFVEENHLHIKLMLRILTMIGLGALIKYSLPNLC